MKLLIAIVLCLGMVGVVEADPIYWVDKNGKQVKSTEERLKNAEDTLDKIYSMLADLHIKQMGVKRYEQVTMNKYSLGKEQ